MELNIEQSKLLELLSSNKKELDEIILEFLPTTHTSPEILNLYQMMRDYPSRGGKGLRGTMCLLWCELFGGKRQNALITASALELFQNWILIHDDIEDQSDLRRGHPSLHRKFGIELAINAGDALHGKMWELLLSNEMRVGARLTLKVLSEFAFMLNETTEGQQMELEWTRGNKWEISEEDYFEMVTKKAAWYTCVTPARLGALLSAGDDKINTLWDLDSIGETLEPIIDYGKDLGIAFQIIDDVLNLTADESKYGKEVFGDLFEGKRTLMLIHLIENSDPTERRKIEEILSKSRGAKTHDDVRFIFDKKKLGSVDYAKRKAQVYSERALSQFDSIVSSQVVSHSGIYQTTRSLIDYLTARDY